MPESNSINGSRHESIQIPEHTTTIHQLLEYLELNSAAHSHFKGKIKILAAKTFQRNLLK
jgi:hypothetical protein